MTFVSQEAVWVRLLGSVSSVCLGFGGYTQPGCAEICACVHKEKKPRLLPAPALEPRMC